MKTLQFKPRLHDFPKTKHPKLQDLFGWKRPFKRSKDDEIWEIYRVFVVTPFGFGDYIGYVKLRQGIAKSIAATIDQYFYSAKRDPEKALKNPLKAIFLPVENKDDIRFGYTILATVKKRSEANKLRRSFIQVRQPTLNSPVTFGTIRMNIE